MICFRHVFFCWLLIDERKHLYQVIRSTNKFKSVSRFYVALTGNDFIRCRSTLNKTPKFNCYLAILRSNNEQFCRKRLGYFRKKIIILPTRFNLFYIIHQYDKSICLSDNPIIFVLCLTFRKKRPEEYIIISFIFRQKTNGCIRFLLFNLYKWNLLFDEAFLIHIDFSLDLFFLIQKNRTRGRERNHAST